MKISYRNKICSAPGGCEKEKCVLEFRKRNLCKVCEAIYKKGYRSKPEIKNKDKENRKKYLSIPENYKKVSEKTKKWKLLNPESVARSRKKYCTKRSNDIIKSLRHNVSSCILRYLKSKNNNSCLINLPYTMAELKQHLENQFEPWMTWENNNKFKLSDYDENDCSTWKWHLDHIIPHSTFNYDSMEHPDFQKCWALFNLRPLNARKNCIEGVSLIRHKLAIKYKIKNSEMMKRLLIYLGID